RKDTTGFEIEASQKINFNDALYAYTIGSAIANGDEKEIGSIEIGKFSDFIVMNGLEEATLSENYIHATYISGESVQEI
ncbi:MAG: amidohydrolase family protein, partial [Fimbriimonadaceae bacterium]|nr:amidohydrolase family protein [Chitinophagales bacterium]